MVDAVRRRPQKDIVTVLTGITGQDMVKGLSGRIRAVVATDATAGNIRMIKRGRRPGRCQVAVITLVARGDVVRRFARRIGTVVARPATARYGSVIH